MAGVCGGVMMRGSWRGAGTILRGSGLAAAGGGAATVTTGGLAGVCGGTAVTGRGGTWLRRAAASCSCFLARMAFSASPGLEMCDRSILGWMPCGARDAAELRDDAPPR